MAKSKQAKQTKVIVDVNQLAAIMDVTSRTIQLWADAGMPQEARGRYDAVSAASWWRDNIVAGKDDKTTSAAKARYWTAKAEQAELDVGNRRGELIPLEEIQPEWSKVVAEIRQGLLSLPVKLPPLVEGKTQPEMRSVVKVEVYRLLATFAREGKHRPAVAIE